MKKIMFVIFIILAFGCQKKEVTTKITINDDLEFYYG